MHKRADAHRDRHTALQEEGKNARLQGADFKTDQKEPKEAWTRWCKLPNSSCAFLTHFIWASCRLLSTPPHDDFEVENAQKEKLKGKHQIPSPSKKSSAKRRKFSVTPIHTQTAGNSAPEGCWDGWFGGLKVCFWGGGG